MKIKCKLILKQDYTCTYYFVLKKDTNLLRYMALSQL